MADSTDSIRQAAVDAMKAGEDVTRRMRDLTLDALHSRRFDRDGMREVVRVVTEGTAMGAGKKAQMRQAMSEAFRGMDQARTRPPRREGRRFAQHGDHRPRLSDTEIKQAIAQMRRLEHDFLETVGQVARSGDERVRPSCATSRERDARRDRDGQQRRTP